MPSLHTIPCEIRIQILANILFSPSDPPVNPSVSQDRKESSSLKSQGIHSIWLKKYPSISTALPLLLVNRLINSEVRDILSTRPEAKEWKLDVMWVKTSGIWPTWTHLPVITDHVKTLEVTFRIFNLPDGLDTKFDRSLVFGLDGSERTMCGFLNCFLMQGPWSNLLSRVSSGQQKPCPPRLSIRKLVIDVENSPAHEDHEIIAPSFFGGDHCLDFKLLNHYHRVRPMVKSPPRNWWWHGSTDMDPKDIPAGRLAYFVADKLRSLLELRWDYFEAGLPLYETILEDITIRANGEFRHKFDIERLLKEEPPYYSSSHSTPGEQQIREMKIWERWLPYVTEQRRLCKEKYL